jgi:hypothetical protein
LVVVGVPVFASGRLPVVGAVAEVPAAFVYPAVRPAGVTVKVVSSTWLLSMDATPMTSLALPAELSEYSPFAPLFPAEMTTTVPSATAAFIAWANGSVSHANASPMLMLTMSMPSACARSIAAIMMSSVVEP